jgi:hypothetical protein
VSGGANTGTGGSGGYGSGRSGGDGGTGIVVIQYADTFPDASSTTGAPTFTNSGGFKTYKFTGSGSITF